MPFNTQDFNEPRRGPRYGSKIGITKEMLECYFGIPEGVRMTGIEWDASRGIGIFYLEATTQVRGTYMIGEGMEVPFTDPTEWMEEATARRFRNLNSNAEAAHLLLRTDDEN